VDNSGNHASSLRAGQIRLEDGPHQIRLEYSQTGGGYEMGWFRAEADGRLESVPWWTLSRRQTGYAAAVDARILSSIVLWSAITLGLSAAWLLKRRWRGLASVFALALMVAATLPGDPITRTSEYEYQVHLSALRHLRWGVDVAPTYGRWGSSASLCTIRAPSSQCC
jgi:hypothetical protein